MPTTPPPITARRLGASGNSRIWSELMVSSTPGMGMVDAAEPVAITMSGALSSWPSTPTLPPLASTPVPRR